MYFRNLLVCIILTLSVSMIFVSAQGESAILCGRVIDKTTSKSLSRVRIDVSDIVCSTQTDKNGEYLISMPAGRHRINFNIDGYEPVTKEIEINQGQNKLDINLSPLITYLPELVVTAEKPAYKKPISSKQTVAQDVVKKTSGPKEDIMETLKTLPGVFVIDDFSAQFSVRGGSPEETSTWLDDVFIIYPYHLEYMGMLGGFVSVFNNEMIEDVTLYSGGFPAEYGNTMSGVIDVKSKRTDKVTGKIGLSLIDGKIYYESPLTDKAGITFSARRNYQDLLLNLILKEDEGFKFMFPSFWDIHLRFDTNLTPRDYFSFYGIRSGTYMYFKVSGEEIPLDILEGNYSYRILWSWLTSGDMLFFNWKHDFDDKISTLISLSFENKYWDAISDIETSYTTVEFTGKSKSWTKTKFTASECKAELNLNSIPKHKIKLGLVYVPYQVNFNLLGMPEFVFNEGSITQESIGEFFEETVTTFYENDTHRLESFLQDEYEIFDRLTLNLGVRYDYSKSNEERNFSPRCSVAYGLMPDMTFRAAWGYYYQLPGVTDFIPGIKGNEELGYRLAIHHIVGLERQLTESVKFRIESYYKDYDRLVSVDPATGIKSNRGIGYSRGTEFFLEKQLSQKVFGWFSYTYSISKRRKHENAKEYYFHFDRTHLGNVVLNYKPDKHWDINLIWKFGTGQPYTPYTQKSKQEDNLWIPAWDEYNSARLPHYHRLDVRFTKHWIYQSWQLSLNLDILNLYNHMNVGGYLWNPAEGKEETVYNMPFFPFIGIEARF